MTMAPSTRDSLILRIKDPGNREAWEQFVAIYEPAMYRSLRLAGLQAADASDLTQELLIKINQHVHLWECGKERGSFRGWLRVVARNLLISWHRQRKRHPWHQATWEQALSIESIEATSDETVELDREESRSIFRLAANQVRGEVHESTWNAFWMVAVDGIPIEQVAKRLQMSQGAVRVAKCRVQARLKEFIKGMTYEQNS